jgi:hypothetical protein
MEKGFLCNSWLFCDNNLFELLAGLNGRVQTKLKLTGDLNSIFF